MNSVDSSRRRTWLVCAALSWLLAGALYLTMPPSLDQFDHAYMGWRWIRGDVPYHDFIDMNWPGTIGLHAIAVWIFGVNLWSWRATDFVLFAVSALFLADLVRRAEGSEAGKYCLVLSPLIYIGISSWTAGQHDMSATHFLVAAVWFHVRAYERPDWRWQLGAGFFVAAAMLCKPTVGVIGALLPLQAIWMRVSLRNVIAHASVLAASILTTITATMAGVVALGTPLSDLIDAIYTYNVAVRNLPLVPTGALAPTDGVLFRIPLEALLSRKWTDMAGEAAPWWLVTGLLALPALPGWLRPRHHSVAASALLVLGLTGMLSYIIQDRGYKYHLSPCLPVLIGGVATSMSRAASRLRFGRADWGRTLGAAYLAVAALWIAERIALNFYSLPLSLAAGDYTIHLARFGLSNGLNTADVVAFARRVEATDRSGCVFAVGIVNAVNYLSERRQPTRFYYFPVIANAREPMPLARKWIALWESDLRKADCSYVLIQDTVSRDWLPGTTRAAQALRALLADYRPIGTMGVDRRVLVYEREVPAE